MKAMVDKYFIMVLFVLLTFSMLCQCNSLDSAFSKRLDEIERKMTSYASLQEEVKGLRDQIVKLENKDLTGQICTPNNSLPSSQGKRFIEPSTFVAFSAFVDNNPSNIGLEQPVPYNRIITNIGGGFNQHTHTFTCPVSGVYMFTFTICHTKKTEFVAKLVVDNQNILDAISQPSLDYEEIQGMNTAIIKVSKGQSVWVAVYFHSDITIRSDNTYRFAAFSGYMIQATQE